jgi:hypothetical protein
MSTLKGRKTPQPLGFQAPAAGAAKRLRLDASARARALQACLREVQAEVVNPGGGSELGCPRRALEEIALLVGADASPGEARLYERFLLRLTRIYAQLWEQRDNSAFAGTAAAYSAVVGALSRRYPRLDYTGPVGQLLELMTRLFAARDNDWKAVYKELRAIPDNVGAKQTLTRVCSADIRQWFDAGVQNLFSLRMDLVGRIRELGAHLADIRNDIERRASELETLRLRLDPGGTGKIVGLAQRALTREIDALEVERREVLEERAGREDTLALIESDIREFEGILREARRAYCLRAV